MEPCWAVLEDGFELMLVNARHVKQVPLRTTDLKDAQWLCQLLETGAVEGELRAAQADPDTTESDQVSQPQISDRQREANRLHKILEDTGFKLGTVETDILGKSRREMLDALVQGTTDANILAELAKGRLRAKLPAPPQATAHP
jgi:hypothetical protein